MSAIEPNWPDLLVFAPAWAIACVGFFYLSGSLPPSAAPSGVRSGIGPALVWLNLGVLIVLLALTAALAFTSLRWTSIIVTAGFIFLFAPFVVQDLPRPLKDTQLGLLLLLCLSVLGLALVAWAGDLGSAAQLLAVDCHQSWEAV